MSQKQRRRLPPAMATFDRRVGPTPSSDHLDFCAKSSVSSSSSKPCSCFPVLTLAKCLPGLKTVAAVVGCLAGSLGGFRRRGAAPAAPGVARLTPRLVGCDGYPRWWRYGGTAVARGGSAVVMNPRERKRDSSERECHEISQEIFPKPSIYRE